MEKTTMNTIRNLTALIALSLASSSYAQTNAPATIFEHTNFEGRSQALVEGLNVGPLALGNDVASSVMVGQCFKVTLYGAGPGQNGPELVLTADDADLTDDDFNDIVSNVLVERDPNCGSASDTGSSFPNGYFRLTTQFRESNGECLEGNQVNGSINGAAFMDKCQNVAGQLWKAIPAENGYFRLTTQFRENEGECLEGNQVGGSNNGAAYMDKCQDVSGQLWRAFPVKNGYFKLTTQFRENEEECLEGNQVGGSNNSAAFMDKCQDVSGQLWKFQQ